MKRFKKELGITIFDYINSKRIYNSLSYYYYDNYILSIGFNNGFNSLEYYSEIFKRTMGVSPIIYKKFLNHNIDVNDSDRDIILNSINKLKLLEDKITRYINNKKPSTVMVKAIVFKK
jgi:hypothetical protein